MRQLKRTLKTIIRRAIDANQIIYVYGDLQDTPDDSKAFHHVTTNIGKHPLGIVQTCENLGLLCTIYQHMESMPTPIISRHGTKGGRFIDGMYTTPQGLPYILGITIITDTGIFSDHDLIVSKCDLGIKRFKVSEEKEERIDYRSIMNIPMVIRAGTDHPTINDSVFKGLQCKHHVALYNQIQEICQNPDYNILDCIAALHCQLCKLEAAITDRTKSSVTIEEQIKGTLIQRLPQDTQLLNDTSARFFDIIRDICRLANLTSKINIVPAAATNALRKTVASEKLMPGIASVPVTKQLDDSLKRTRMMYQRIRISVCTVTRLQRAANQPHQQSALHKTLNSSIRKLVLQQPRFNTSISTLCHICEETETECANHIAAIEHARNKRIYDRDKEFQAEVLEQQGRQVHDTYIRSIKQAVFGAECTQTTQTKHLGRLSGHHRIQHHLASWNDMYDQLTQLNAQTITQRNLKHLYKLLKKAIHITAAINLAINQMRKAEWKNAKTHYIRTGRYRNIANMINTKHRTGPTARNIFPAKPGEQVRHAINDEERMGASLITHEKWMANPPGSQNCHFLDLVRDDIGPTGVHICCDKPFDPIAQWKYLDGILDQKLGTEIADRVQLAHKKLPKLFETIKTDTVITYPFKYHCESGEYMYPELEANIRKNVSKGSGKAGATGFAIPVLGRLPKMFADVYILKCKLQMALRLLDLQTENSLRICIGKPGGGVRPLTVGHDDNIFLNGLAQQAIQNEIARIKLLPDNVCSYQRGKGCADASIPDLVVKEIALQTNDCYVAKVDDDAEKMLDRLHLELQVALLMLAGAGLQGFTEWQCANMADRTNKLVTDIFVSMMKYQCGLPQGNGFSVEVANFYALLLLLW